MATLAELKALHRREVGDLAPVLSSTQGATPRAEPQVETCWQMITLSLPRDTPLGVPNGQWERSDGRIIATYTREELTVAVGLALEQRRHELVVRLERGLEVLEAATGCDDAEADRLLVHWDGLNAEYDQVVEAMRAVGLDGTDTEGVETWQV